MRHQRIKKVNQLLPINRKSEIQQQSRTRITGEFNENTRNRRILCSGCLWNLLEDHCHRSTSIEQAHATVSHAYGREGGRKAHTDGLVQRETVTKLSSTRSERKVTHRIAAGPGTWLRRRRRAAGCSLR